MQVTVAGSSVNFNSLSVSDQIDQISAASFIVIGTVAQNFMKGQQVVVYDDVNQYRPFGGVIERAKVFVPNPANSTAIWSIECTDNHFFAQKRIVAKTYSSQVAGDIVADIITNYLAAEGIVGTRTQPTFTRATVAYKLDGSSVSSGNVRYDTNASVLGAFIEEGTTNLLSANQASVETNTTGFTSVNTGTVLTRVTTEHWTGTAALQIATTGASGDSGFVTTNIAGTLATKYAISAWVKAPNGTLLKLIAKDNTNNGTTTTNFSATGAWQYVNNTIVYGASSGTGLQLKVLTQGTQAAVTFYVDGMQIEAKPMATSFIDGGGTRNAESLSIPTANIIQASEGTIAVRVYITAESIEQTQDRFIFFEALGSGAGRISLFHSASAAIWRVTFSNNQSTIGFHSIDVAESFAASGGWHTFAVRWSTTEASVWIDGTNRGTLADLTCLPTALGSTLYIGSDAGTNQGNMYFAGFYAAYEWLGDAAMATLSASTLAYNDTCSYYISFNNALTAQTTIFDGATITTAILNYATANDCINAIAEKCDYYWLIDSHKVLKFGPREARTAPFVLNAGIAYGSSSVMRDGTIQYSDESQQFRTTEYIVGGQDKTASQVEIQKGDGSKQTFTVGYAIAQVPTVETNIASAGYTTKTVGIKGVDTGKDFYWNENDFNIYQDASGTKLNSVDLIRITYVGYFPVIIYVQDDHLVVQRALIEGGSGKTEVAELAPADVTSRTAGYQLANAKLQRYSVLGKILEFDTFTGGLKAGQLATANVAEYGISAQSFLIESVEISTPNTAQVNYHVKAIQGPASGSWVEFFRVIASKQSLIDQLNVGSATILIVVSSTTETWTWTETINETVYTCPICSGTTLCGGGTIVC